MHSQAVDAQIASAGGSEREIHEGVLAIAQPASGLSWLDVGCGTGEILRLIRERHAPRRLVGVDLIDWLRDDLRPYVEMVVGPAEEALRELGQFDRVLLAETLEHLAAPWSTLELACGLVAPGGRIVLSTPNVASLRHRFELLVRGRLTSFRPDNEPHLTPVLPHVAAAVARHSGLEAEPEGYACADVIPLTGGRRWPERLRRRAAGLTSVSVIVCASRQADGRIDTRGVTE